ncbi:sugar transferase [Bradyrhizobium sp. CCGUVB23]|uniref:sugar transferase n=1 Tax=Bradyrhizobium sp. CCGUVB23 TaxID=2949630 RepID=UPI0020B1B14E|nr:sugar transferase [Bradyrhizobium sp. CCGUVB23]MCP3460399.1 sugar transferase [Bradyrhizobium sp. CCGUVB23]
MIWWGASLALIIFVGAMLVTATLIAVTSKGSVIFRQNRVGFNGRVFRILKFRTMRTVDDGPMIVQAGEHDPRVTSLGKWLRKHSIDELPQLINVLRGAICRWSDPDRMQSLTMWSMKDSLATTLSDIA